MHKALFHLDILTADEQPGFDETRFMETAVILDLNNKTYSEAVSNRWNIKLLTSDHE